MEFTGRIMKVLPARSGVSKAGKEWKTQQFIFEYFENPSDRYSDKVVIETFDTNVMAQLEENATVRIGFGHRFEEYNGNYYNRLTMYKFERLDHTTAMKPKSASEAPTNGDPSVMVPPQPKQEEKKDDLPF